MIKHYVAPLIFVLFFDFIGLSRGRNFHSTRQYFCGTRLVHALSLICETYNSPSEGAEDYPQQKGIIETCCQRPCSRNILASYCESLKAEVGPSLKNHGKVKIGTVKKFSKMKKTRKVHKTKKGIKKAIRTKKKRKKYRSMFERQKSVSQ